MRYIIFIIFLVCGYNTQAKDTSVNSIIDVTEVENTQVNINSIPDTIQTLNTEHYNRLLQIAKDNINNATEDSHRLNTYKWFKSLAPTEYIVKLNIWLNAHYPKFKYYK